MNLHRLKLLKHLPTGAVQVLPTMQQNRNTPPTVQSPIILPMTKDSQENNFSNTSSPLLQTSNNMVGNLFWIIINF